ncbi:hypothetical protein GCM10022228_13400 [Halomonas cibimaris]|uniref:DUF1090 domain-containing protein n=1 Tax=Halomonas cibimaris TaxID=657012 RepID=A0ABP7LQZ0_9GAMM
MLKILAPFLTRSASALAGLALLLAAAPALASSSCDSVTGCDWKFCEIENKLSIAQQHGNDHQIAGLKKALQEATRHCTDEGLREELIDDLQDAREDLAEHESDLAEAKANGDADDRRQYQQEVEEKKADIQRLENELSRLD